VSKSFFRVCISEVQLVSQLLEHSPINLVKLAFPSVGPCETSGARTANLRDDLRQARSLFG